MRTCARFLQSGRDMRIPLLSALFLGVLSTPANAGVLEDLAALTARASDGGAAITGAEAAQFAASAGGYSADEAILGIVAAGGMRVAGHFPTDEAYGAILQALRFRVEGLALTLRQAPGVTFVREESGVLVVTMDPQAIGYTRVDIVYTWDGWATARGATLRAGRDGKYRATLPAAPRAGRLAYAMHLFGPDGQDFWIDNPRELGVYGGTAHLDHSLDLAATFASPDDPTAPAFVQLLRTFTHPASPGGASITLDEFSLLVEEITWEGGTAVEERRVLVPVLSELSRLEQTGATFESADLAGYMRQFLQNQILRTATFPGAAFQRAAGGRLQLALDLGGAVSARVYYSTDGWGSPHVVECAGVCALGYLPPDALLSYTIGFVQADGSTHWVRSVLGNFFHELPIY